jgi:hypothetical protein
MADREFKIEEKEGGRLFHLRNDVKLLVKWSSEKKVQVELWRNDAVVPPDTGNPYLSNFRDRIIAAAVPVLFAETEVKKKDTEEDAEQKRKARAEFERVLREDIGDVAIALNAPTAAGQTLHAQLGAALKGPSVTERLVRYGRKGAKFFHNPERIPYAAVKVGEHTEHYRIGSKDFRDWLEQEYWTGEEKRLHDEAIAARGALAVTTGDDAILPDVVRDRDLSDAVRLLRGIAVFKGPEHEVYRRIAPYEGAVYIDLCDEIWRVIEVDTDGWRIIAGHEAPVKFTRTPGMLPLCQP